LLKISKIKDTRRRKRDVQAAVCRDWAGLVSFINKAGIPEKRQISALFEGALERTVAVDGPEQFQAEFLAG
jgi:hypothetical protein